jgi:hypothetical protein
VGPLSTDTQRFEPWERGNKEKKGKGEGNRRRGGKISVRSSALDRAFFVYDLLPRGHAEVPFFGQNHAILSK